MLCAYFRERHMAQASATATKKPATNKPDPKVTAFIKDASRWRKEMEALRKIALDSGLSEALKWNKPCYGFNGANLAIIQPFKEQCGFMFFKGALLKDPKGLLESPGEHSQTARRLMFTSPAQVEKMAPKLRAFIAEAVKAESAGLKVAEKKAAEPLPDELTAMYKKMPGLKAAFEALTPGRQRAYLIHFSAAKQSATRTSRIAKYVPCIMAGKGMND